ncbi:MAG: hypothetical protein COB36_12325 [Alphaproteobacteria bacterium]|nr:MAG: hypothetical protein COB36_12325 [Alphaproteobacteria bacterium]
MDEFQMDGLDVETGIGWDATAWPVGTIVDVNITVDEDNAPMQSKTKIIVINVVDEESFGEGFGEGFE